MGKSKLSYLVCLSTLLSAFPLGECHAGEHTTLQNDSDAISRSPASTGISVESVLTHDLMANVAGGVRRNSAILGNCDLTISLDSSKAGLWDGGTTFLYILGNYGEEISQLVGDTQSISNIEAFGTVKLYEAWHDQEIGKYLQVLFGLHDYNSEFYRPEYAGSLLNSSFGIGIDVSQVTPSIFSTTSLAGRIRLSPSESSYILAAAYDGVPGSPFDQSGTQIVLQKNDGFFYALELGITENEPDHSDYYKLAMGAWYHTAEFEDFAGHARDRNEGVYLVAEKSLWRQDESARGIGAFLQLGFAPESRNQIANYFGSGLNFSGLLPGRAEDTTSLGIAIARNGDSFLDASEDFERSETALELNHSFKILPYLTIQPDIQWIINPGTDPALDNALVLGIRSEIEM